MASVRLDGVTKRFGNVTALKRVTLEIGDGEFFTVLGPPGAGKTTLLRSIVGLERPEEGDIYVDGDRVNDVYPGDRDIAIMFQNLALYADKKVYDNLAFPLRQRKVPKATIDERVRSTAQTLRIEHLLQRKPGKLSGGERQRVALGRTMVRDPRVMLLDEPLSALDALLRLEMRAELKRLQQELGRTLVYVTHDQVEAMSMSERIAVLHEGALEQIATPEEIYNQPTSRFVATVVGSPPMNFVECRAARTDSGLAIEHPRFTVQVAPTGQTIALADGADCLLGIRPEDVHLDDSGFPADVYVTEPLGGETVVDLEIGGLVVKALVPPTLAVEAGTSVRVAFDPARLHLFSGDGKALLHATGEPVFIMTPTG